MIIITKIIRSNKKIKLNCFLIAERRWAVYTDQSDRVIINIENKKYNVTQNDKLKKLKLKLEKQIYFIKLLWKICERKILKKITEKR